MSVRRSARVLLPFSCLIAACDWFLPPDDDSSSTGAVTTSASGGPTDDGHSAESSCEATTSGETTTSAGGTSGGSTTGEDSNDAPVASADALWTAQGVALAVAAPGVLANDLDADGDPLSVASADDVTERGVLVDVDPDGSVGYVPPAGFWGNDRFEYTVTDGELESVAAVVDLHVAPRAVALAQLGAATEGFRINGQFSQDGSGEDVAVAGDVNGDGLADVVVGAPFADLGMFGSGADGGLAYVVFGTNGNTPVDLGAVAAGGGGGFVISGEDTGDQAGRSVAPAGDVNGDGLADLIVGAPFTDQSGSSSGRAYVVFGKLDTDPVGLGDVRAGFGGFAIEGASFSGWLGEGVAAAGDLDGDGLGDLVVGAPFESIDGFGQGRAYVVFGKLDTDVVSASDLLAGIGGFAIEGAAPGDAAGSSVAGGGDIDGDGTPDLVIGAPSAGDEGRAYVVFGKADTALVELSDVVTGVGGFEIVGENPNDSIGHAVGNAGDFDGDGFADIVLGTPQPADHGILTGRAYVVLGKPDTAAIDLDDVRAGVGGFAMIGEVAIDQAGHSVAGAGDVDDDGFDDVIIGSYGAGNAGDQRGRAYVVYGGYAGGSFELSTVGFAVGGFEIAGENFGGMAGVGVGGGGDVDGDGVDDVVVGAPGEPGNSSGRTYVVPGVPTQPD